MDQNTDKDSYGSEALRIPSVELLFGLVFWRGNGQFLSLTNVSSISIKRRDTSPVFFNGAICMKNPKWPCGWHVPVRQDLFERCYLQRAG